VGCRKFGHVADLRVCVVPSTDWVGVQPGRAARTETFLLLTKPVLPRVNREMRFVDSVTVPNQGAGGPRIVNFVLARVNALPEGCQ
jgi:hypothetical protein